MNIKYIILFSAALILFAAGGYWLGHQSSKSTGAMQQASATDNGQTEPQDDREVLYWKAPMNPSEIYDKPGKSVMGMALVPVYAGEAQSSEGQVRINPVVVQNMNIRTAPVQRKNLTTTLQTVGKITYDEQKLYKISTKISGWIEKLYANYSGQKVQRGQALYSIYSPELVTTQREYLLALQANDKMKENGGASLLKAARKRLDYWDIPQEEIALLKQTGEVRKTLTLRSPASGVITMKHVVEGEHIKAGTTVYQIADLSTVWVQASVYDYEVPWIREGQPAEMELSYQPGKVYKGKVAYVYPEVEQESRTVQVRLEFPNPKLDLKPGMYADVRIQVHPITNAVVIPSEAVIRTGERNVVFVVQGEGQFEPREVTLGVEGGLRNEDLQVLSGVKPGEMVVTSAQFLIDSESNLQEAIQKMLKQKQSPNAGKGNRDMEGMDMKMKPDTGSASDTANNQKMKEMNR